jgi:hypothetical protein
LLHSQGKQMAITEHELLIQLQARILAQEMFMRTVLTAAFMNTPNPLASLEELRSDLVRAANEGVRPQGEYEDNVWKCAMTTFDGELNQIAQRLEKQLAGSSRVDELARSTTGSEEDLLVSVFRSQIIAHV